MPKEHDRWDQKCLIVQLHNDEGTLALLWGQAGMLVVAVKATVTRAPMTLAGALAASPGAGGAPEHLTGDRARVADAGPTDARLQLSTVLAKATVAHLGNVALGAFGAC